MLDSTDLSMRLPPESPPSTNGQSWIPDALSTSLVCLLISKSNPGGTRALLRWHDQLHRSGSRSCLGEAFANPAMQKIAWEISSDSMVAEHGARSMNTGSKDKLLGVDSSPPATAEQRIRQLGIKLPTPPEPFGIYTEAVQTGNLLFLTGMLPTVGREAKFIGHIGAELEVQTGRQAARLAALNGLAVARQHLGSLDKVTRVVRLGVLVATSGDVRDQPKVADGAS